MKILVPVDISHQHDDLVDHLDWLLNLKDNEFELLFVKEVLPSYERLVDSMADFPDDWENQIESKAREVLNKLSSKFEEKGAQSVVEVATGPTSSVINNIADAHNIDLTVVSPGKGAHIRRFLLGSTSSQVVKHSAKPVLVLRDKEGQSKLEHIVVAVDGSEDSKYALDYVCKLFHPADRDIKITLINVVSVAQALVMVSPAPFIAQLETNLTLAAGVIVSEAKNQLLHAGVKNVETEVKVGDAANELIDFADENSVQLIVSGRKGHSGVKHIVMGSVAERLSAHSQCSNLVVNRPE